MPRLPPLMLTTFTAMIIRIFREIFSACRPSAIRGSRWQGLDVVIGAGYGVEKEADKAQGSNYLSGNRYLAEEDLRAIDVRNGGRYIVVTRQRGVGGGEALSGAAIEAARSGSRLFGFYGTKEAHLPFETADGDYRPVAGRKPAEQYTSADIEENPTLAEMTAAALVVLSRNERGFWLMVEPGDVDWANHDNNLDTSIGAVNSGDAAVRTITEWVERHSDWRESLLIVTADHGHYLVIARPELLARQGEQAGEDGTSER